jgi:hypothetical protein
MKFATWARWLLLLVVTQQALAQVPNPGSEAQIGENLHLNAGGLLSAGYTGNYGEQIQNAHGLNFGLDGALSGYYYNPNFLNFNLTPFYNQSRADSNYQSLTGSSGVNATANLFAGSHFPGSVSYRYDHDSTGTFGLLGQPSFTTVGNGQGYSVAWSALIPNYPTLSVSYSQGIGSGNVYGTTQETSADTKVFNARSTYRLADFRLNGYYDHNTLHSTYPEFLSGTPANQVSDSTGNDYGLTASHDLPLHGAASVNYTRSDLSSSSLGISNNSASYTTSNETAFANFHPTTKIGFFLNQSYTDNLAGYLNQALVSSGGVAQPINLGSHSDSSNVGGGANYQFTTYLTGQVQATYYDQAYFGQRFTGSFISGTVNYNRRLWSMFTFSGSVVESRTGPGNDSVGFLGNVNYFRMIDGWETGATFTYAQNVQTILVNVTTSSYNYSGNLHRRFTRHTQWTAAFNGTHSGFTNQPDTSNHSESYTTSFSFFQVQLNGNYIKSSGNSILGANGLQIVPPTPGLPSSALILFRGTSYGGGLSITPLNHLTLTGNFSHSASDTINGSISSNNKTQIIFGQMQYHFRKLNFLAGYTRLSQGISASGTPAANANSYFFGVSRWFSVF